MSKLLINASPMIFQSVLAAKIGLNESIALQQLHYLLNPEFNQNFKGGRYWVYNTYTEWKDQWFPFWSEKTTKRTFLNLEEMDLIISKRLGDYSRDRTKWYTINYEALNRLEIGTLAQNGPMQESLETLEPKMGHSNGPNWPSPLAQNGPMSKVQEIIQKITQENNNVELASNATTVIDEPPLILEAEPTNYIPEPKPEKQPEPLATTTASQPKAKSNPNHWAPLVASIFAYWQTVLKHPRAKLDTHRRRSITHALRLGFSEDELKKAINGISKSPYHMGENERKIVYDDLDLIFRNAKYIEKFMGFDDKPPVVPVAKPTHNGKSFWQQDADLSRRLYELDLQDWKKWQEMAKAHPACKQEIIINPSLELQ